MGINVPISVTLPDNWAELVAQKPIDRGDCVLVVRCRDCKYNHKDSRGCEKNHDFDRWLPADFFCADGERRETE